MGKTKKKLLLDTEKLVVKEKSDKFHSSELQAFEALSDEVPKCLPVMGLVLKN